MEDKKRYNQMENVLHKINQKYISLPEGEKKRNNKILEQVTEKITSLMKDKDILFRTMYERKFYGGSYYDGIKVGKPEEYDLDFVLNLPLIIEPAVEDSNKPGFVHIRIMEYAKLVKRDEAPRYEKLDTLMVNNYLSTSKVLQWMEKALNLALNEVEKENGVGHVFDVDLGDDGSLKIYATVSKAHPAFTLKLSNKNELINLDIDLVPCFQFTNEKWPKGAYRPNPFPSKNKYLVVPKKPHDMVNCNIEKYWRLSFQEQERELIKGQEFKIMKPTLKLLKKLRDQQNHGKIASYFIKTIYLWEAAEQDQDFWKQSQSYVFMAMLKKYATMVQNKKIPYYWNVNYNLIGHVKDTTLKDIGNTLKNIIEDIEKNLGDPFVVGKYLINSGEVETLRGEVDIGKKHKKTLITTQCLTKPISLLGIDHTVPDTEEEKIKRLVFNDEFVQEVLEHIAKYLQPKLPLSPGTGGASCSTKGTSDTSTNNDQIVTSLNGLHAKTNTIVGMITNLADDNIKLMKTCNNLNEKMSSLENDMADLTIQNSELKSQLKNITKAADNNTLNFDNVSDSALFDKLALTANTLPKLKNTENVSLESVKSFKLNDSNKSNHCASL